MGLSIGDSARSLPTFQSVGALQGREPVRPRPEVRPVASTAAQAERVRLGPVAPSSREEIVQAALREPVSSPAGAAVRALGTSFRALREGQPSLEEQRAQVRERFDQAREQVFGREGERAAIRAERQAEATQASEDARTRTVITPAETAPAATREVSTQDRTARFTPPERPEPVAPNPRILQRFDEPAPPGSVDLRG